MERIIINADDFGLNSSVNLAIVELFKSRQINSTSLMANMPGFDQAVELAHKEKLLNQIGAHLNLTEGKPITAALNGSHLFYKEINYNLKKHKKKLFWLTKNQKIMIFNEFSAQVEKIKKSGIPISHVDTHNHIHEIWPITKIIFEILKKYQIPSMRILNNLNESSKFYKTAYRSVVNNMIQVKKVNFSNFFGNQPDSFNFLRNNPSILNDHILEVMVHPDFNSSGIIVDKIREVEELYAYPQDIAELINKNL